MPWPPETLRWSSPAHTPPPPAGSSPGSLAECFPPEHVSVVTGGRQENACLLEPRSSTISSSQAARQWAGEVLLHAAQYLTPVTLELGGKSPCIVDETADLKLTARRIVFGKYLNSARPAWPPTYLLCQESVKDAPAGGGSSGRSLFSSARPPGQPQLPGRSSTRSTSSDCWGLIQPGEGGVRRHLAGGGPAASLPR